MSSKNLHIVENILNKLLTHYKLKNDAALSRRLGITPAVLSAWRKRGSINTLLIIEMCSDVDLNWLFRNEEPAAPSAALPASNPDVKEPEKEVEQLRGQVQVLRSLVIELSKGKEGV